MRPLLVAGTVVLALALTAEPAWAWGPGTHVFLGTEILGALSLLPAGIAALLRRYPLDFLYGCVAADITFGKKYAPVGRHCHHWHIGEELYETAESEATRACALGYLSHLAADTTAHNFFLPRRLLTSASTQAIGHSYWEHRMDLHLGDQYVQAARQLVVEFDHSHNDALFDEVLDRTVFSFQTNRRIFRGMIRLAGHETWQAFFDRVIDLSRWDVEPSEVETWMRLTFDYTVDYIVRRQNSIAAQLDPTGDVSLQEARRLRRDLGTKRNGLALQKLATERFAWPTGRPEWWHLRVQARGIQPPLVLPAVGLESVGDGDYSANGPRPSVRLWH